MVRNFGPVMQNGFLVRDMQAALDHWIDVMNVGPFFMFEHVQFSTLLFKGEPSPLDMSMALSYSGDVQIELIVQHNDAPSIFTDFIRAGRYGLQHMGVMTPSVDSHVETLRGMGIQPTQYGITTVGARVAYVSTDMTPGFMIELIEANEAMVGAFRMIHEAAKNWNGKDRVVRF